MSIYEWSLARVRSSKNCFCPDIAGVDTTSSIPTLESRCVSLPPFEFLGCSRRVEAAPPHQQAFANPQLFEFPCVVLSAGRERGWLS